MDNSKVITGKEIMNALSNKLKQLLISDPVLEKQKKDERLLENREEANKLLEGLLTKKF